MLAKAFLERYIQKSGADAAKLHFQDDTLAALRAYPWPGNVRELEHLVERLCVMEKGPALTPAMLPPEFRGQGGAVASISMSDSVEVQPEDSKDGAIDETPSAVGSPAAFQLAEIERNTILRALEHTRGHRNQATELLGISIRTLRNKLTQYRQEGTLPAEFQ